MDADKIDQKIIIQTSKPGNRFHNISYVAVNVNVKKVGLIKREKPLLSEEQVCCWLSSQS